MSLVAAASGVLLMVIGMALCTCACGVEVRHEELLKES